MKKAIKIIVGIFVLIMILGTICDNNNNKTESKKETVKNVQLEEVKEKKFDFSSAELTEENIKKALGNKFDNCTIEITIEDGKNIIDVKYNAKDVWDEKSLVKSACNSTLIVLDKLRVNPKIDIIHYWVYTEFTDAYGNAEDTLAMQLGFTKEEFNKMNIENLKSTIFVDYERFINLSNNKYIHPSIQSKL